MSVKDCDICGAAIGVFQSLIDSLYDGNTTPTMLMKLDAKLEQVNKIIEAIDYTPSGEKPQSPKDILLKRKNEYAVFRKYRQQLQYLCHHIRDLNVEGYKNIIVIHKYVLDFVIIIIIHAGMDLLQEEFKIDFDNLPTSHICSSDETNTVVIHCFKIGHSLNPILEKFKAISQEYSTDFFQTFWNRQKQKHKDATSLNVLTVVQIWKDTLKECIAFVKSLQDGSISLSSVQELVTKREENLLQDITNLEAGICVCKGATPPTNPVWIRNCVLRMYQYQSLCHHASAAKVFVELKETLQLTGDFSMVEKLADEVSNLKFCC